jgi:hypothetical protein
MVLIFITKLFITLEHNKLECLKPWAKQWSSYLLPSDSHFGTISKRVLTLKRVPNKASFLNFHTKYKTNNLIKQESLSSQKHLSYRPQLSHKIKKYSKLECFKPWKFSNQGGILNYVAKLITLCRNKLESCSLTTISNVVNIFKCITKLVFLE